MRARIWMPMLLGMTLLLGGCASADRVATLREETTAPSGKAVYRLEWMSDAYGEQILEMPRPDRGFEQSCYDHVVVGEAIPFDCMTLVVLRDETDAFGRNPWLAFGFSVAMVGGLVLFSIRWIDWRPAPSLAAEVPTSSEGSSAAVELMRSVESEKESRGETAALGRDLPHPGWAGIGAGLLTLAVLTALVGFGSSVSWGLLTAVLMFFGVGSVAIVLVVRGLSGRSNMDPLIRRLFFLGGFIVVVLFGSLVGQALWWPLYWLNGVDWPI